MLQVVNLSGNKRAAAVMAWEGCSEGERSTGGCILCCSSAATS